MIRAHRRPGRQLSREVADLTYAAAGATAARGLTRTVLTALAGQPSPGTATVASTVAAHCTDDGQRSALAAYLYLCRDLSPAALGKIFGVDAPAARRLVERGTGRAPVTAGDECRGWALIAPRPGRTPAERRAGSGHLSLCRKCRNKLRAHTVLQQRMAAAGSVGFGASVAATVGRVFAGTHAAGSAVGALTGPIVALSTAAALTAGAGTLALTSHGARHRVPAGTVRPHPGATVDVSTTPAAVSRPAPSSASSGAPAERQPSTPRPGLPAGQQLLPVQGTPAVPLPTVSLPTVSVPSLPLPLPTTGLSPPALPTKLPLPVPVPLPTLKLPQLP